MAKRQGKRANFVMDKLFIDGVRYDDNRAEPPRMSHRQADPIRRTGSDRDDAQVMDVASGSPNRDRGPTRGGRGTARGRGTGRGRGTARGRGRGAGTMGRR